MVSGSGSVLTVHRVDGKLSVRTGCRELARPGLGWSQDAGIAAALDTGMSSQQLVSVVTTDTVSASSCRIVFTHCYCV